MAKACIGIGSNVGDRAACIQMARQELGSLPRTRLVGFSRVYETEPVGPVEQGRYLNAAAVLETQLAPRELLIALNQIEQRAGREPLAKRVKWGPRTLDLDILLYDDQVIAEEDLIVPHPFMHQRAFVLEPLAELDAQAVHPVLDKSVMEMLEELRGETNPGGS